MLNKRPTGLNGHLSIRDFQLTSCQRGSYLYINSPSQKINDGIGKQHHNPLTQQQSTCCILIEQKIHVLHIHYNDLYSHALTSPAPFGNLAFYITSEWILNCSNDGKCSRESLRVTWGLFPIHSRVGGWGGGSYVFFCWLSGNLCQLILLFHIPF